VDPARLKSATQEFDVIKNPRGINRYLAGLIRAAKRLASAS
jgi:hypothetical protein